MSLYELLELTENKRTGVGHKTEWPRGEGGENGITEREEGRVLPASCPFLGGCSSLLSPCLLSTKRCSLCCLLHPAQRANAFPGVHHSTPSHSCTPRAHQVGNSQKGHRAWHIQTPRAAVIRWKSENLTKSSLAAFRCFWESIHNQPILESVK